MAVKPTNLRPLSETEERRTLATNLVPVADGIRQLATDFGARPYRVRLVWLQWTQAELDLQLVTPEEQPIAAEIGAGRAYVLRELEILPTPKVQSMAAVRKRLLRSGRTEDGTITVDRISRSFSEDVLTGLLPELRDPERPECLLPGIQFFWELQEDRPARWAPSGAGAPLLTDDRASRRKFNLVGVPHLSGGGAHWSVSLLLADGERGRDGEVP